MSIEERKLSFYFLGSEISIDKSKEKANTFSSKSLDEFCKYVNTLDPKIKTIDITTANKIVQLDSLNIYSKQGLNFIKGLVQSGKYNHSPGYISKLDGVPRTSDKKMEEAYAEKTHFLGTIQEDGITLLFESRQAGASIGMVVKCLNQIRNGFKRWDGYFYYNPIAVDNLEETIRDLTRIKIGHVYYDKTYLITDGKILGDIKNRNSVQKDVTVTVKAERGESIPKEGILDLLRKAGSEGSMIHRVRLEASNENGNTIIDTLLTKKVNNVNVGLDSKGLVDDYSIFSRMEDVFGIDE